MSSSPPLTRSCRAPSAPSRRPRPVGALRAARGLNGLLVIVLLGCGQGTPPSAGADAATDGGGADVGLARSLLAPATPLPVRAEVVALTDRLAIASSRAGRTPTGAELALLAAELRERLWRLDQRATDAREAMELYGAVVQAAAGTVRSCQADRRRAVLVGDATHDASRAFRELYLAHRRQRAVGEEPGLPARRACLRALEDLLAGYQAFRPSGDEWQALEREGDRAAAAQGERITGPALAPSASGSSQQPPQTPAAELLASDRKNIVVAPDPSQVGDGPVELTKIQPFSWEQGGRVVLTLSAPTTYKLNALGPDGDAGRGHRIYLDVARARRKGVARSIEAGGLIERVRLGRRKEGTRVVVDLSAAAYQKVFYLLAPFRIVIDLSTRPPARPGRTAGEGKRVVRRVTLDPGHGGEDAGAIGPTGLREKDVTLDIAHRAAPALAHELGVETMLTRDTDEFIFLEERAARANAFHSDLFVSIHCNATEDGVARGVQLFILDPSREMDAVAQRVASRENAVANRRGRPYDAAAVDAQIAAVAAGLNTGDLAVRSGHLADLLKTSVFSSFGSRYPGTRDHGIRTAGFYVLLGAEMPAVLFETSFISNPDDEALLATADYRQKLADGVVNAVRAYRDGR